MTDRELMQLAIAELEKCSPTNPEQVPKVGAVIAIDGEVIAANHRGKDDHAEKRAFSGYTVYDVLGSFVGKDGDPTYDASSCIRIIDIISQPDECTYDNALTSFFKLGPTEQTRLFRSVIRTKCGLRLHHDDTPNLGSIVNQKIAVQSLVVDEVSKYFDEWGDLGAFLLYGFLGYYLIKVGAKEEEIWLTSHFAVVNSYKKIDEE